MKDVNKLTNLNKVIAEINRGTYLGDEEDGDPNDEKNKFLWCRPYKLSLRLENEDDCQLLCVLDDKEELYYDGFQFEKTIEKLDEALRKDLKDDDAFFDCYCPGKWVIEI